MKSKIARLKSARKIRSKLTRGDLHRLTTRYLTNKLYGGTIIL